MNVSGEFSGLIGHDGQDYNMQGLYRSAGDHSYEHKFAAGQKLVGVRRVKATTKLTFSATDGPNSTPTVYSPDSDFNNQNMIRDDIYVGSTAGAYITSISMSPDGGVVEYEKNFITTPSGPTDPPQSSTTVVVVVAAVVGFAAIVAFTLWMRAQRATTRAQPPPTS
jgi:hypothetical protein